MIVPQELCYAENYPLKDPTSRKVHQYCWGPGMTGFLLQQVAWDAGSPSVATCCFEPNQYCSVHALL